MNFGKIFKRWFNPRPVDGYVSDIDQFLQQFNAEHPEDPHAAEEREKFVRLNHSRDCPVPKNPANQIWKGF